ncbi:MAG: glycosyltransferase [Desulfovibrio sp.]|nr:glycosyltransferase [Desulfovibrio sp.]
MARIAYVDHSYHLKTRSNEFLAELLRGCGHTVDVFRDEGWLGGRRVHFKEVINHDIVIMFQARCAPDGITYASHHPNVVYIPMLDEFFFHTGPKNNLADFWKSFAGAKVLSFSRIVHAIATAFGVYSFPARYYQPPAPVRRGPAKGLRGFFWLRMEQQISWPVIRHLIGEAKFDNLHIHYAPDPGSFKPTLPDKRDFVRYGITTSTWFEDRAELLKIMRSANVYFAPRLEEGIGQSFLEAMAMGQCVVAVDNGTMNEYIFHGVNGLLYSETRPAPLDFSDVARIGKMARLSVEKGYAAWKAREKDMADFIAHPAAEFYPS